MAALATAPLVRFDPDFEAVIGLHSHTDRVLHGWRRFSDLPPTAIPPALRDLVEATLRLRRGA